MGILFGQAPAVFYLLDYALWPVATWPEKGYNLNSSNRHWSHGIGSR